MTGQLDWLRGGLALRVTYVPASALAMPFGDSTRFVTLGVGALASALAFTPSDSCFEESKILVPWRLASERDAVRPTGVHESVDKARA